MSFERVDFRRIISDWKIGEGTIFSHMLRSEGLQSRGQNRGVSKLDLKPISLFDQRVSTSNLKLSLGSKSSENSIYTRFRNHFSKYINSQYVIFSFDICKSNINENVNRVHFCQIHAYRYLLAVHSIQELNILTLNMLFGYVNRNVNRVHFYVYL